MLRETVFSAYLAASRDQGYTLDRL
jgi:hypothetical protein